MKIGILTFHWATNYGAILQAFALQEFLEELGHEVEIINYKPKQYDFSWKRIIRQPALWKTLPRLLANEKKESLLVPFRVKYLKTTKRYSSFIEFGEEINKYDVLISGSDQVLNPSFTMRGEDGAPSPVYWLGFGNKNTKKLGYAVSFGCEHYPDNAKRVANQLVNGFAAIGTRENSGLNILTQLGFSGLKCLTPDPTLLLGSKLFKKMSVLKQEIRQPYTCVYMLRHEISVEGDVRYIDEKHSPLTMEEWLETIVNAKHLVTNSYHGMIMALLAHVPFVVLFETGLGKGMNDRFKSLLSQLQLENRVASSVNEALEILENPIDFDKLDVALEEYRQLGVDFLKRNI